MHVYILNTKRFSLFIYFLLCIIILARANTDKFFGSNNQLSNSHVNYIYQDSKGYIWICTENGLNLFDGIKFKTFTHIANDTTSLNNNLVLSVLEDSCGKFWVGTSDGVQILDRETGLFQKVNLSYRNITNFNYIKCITEDSNGHIWLSTNHSGIIRIDKESMNAVYYMHTNSNICSNKINTIYEDRFGNIWIGSQDNGISVLNIDNHTIDNYAHDPKNKNSLSSNKIFSIIEEPSGKILVATIDGTIDAFDYNSRTFERDYIPSVKMVYTLYTDSKKNLWIGTDGNGLKCYNFNDKTLTTYESELINLDMREAKVHSIFEDKQHNIWVALYQKGVLMIPLKDKIFKNIGFNPFYNDKNIGNECCLTILEDHNKEIWVGTDGDGIYKLDTNRQVKTHYSKDEFPANVVLSIFEDSQNRIWVGTYLYGLYLYNESTNRFIKKSLYYNNTEVLHVNTIAEDSNGNLWIGTNEHGVCKYDPATGDTEFLLYNVLKSKNQILSNSVNTIDIDGHYLWIGTSVAGVSRYNMVTGTFEDYTVENGKLSNNNIFALKADQQGGVWIGTNWGLNYINPSTKKVLQYTEEDGLPNAAISGIVIDSNKHLWISTYYGLSYYNPQKNRFINYYTSDGLINNEFRRGAYFQSKSGEIFFGGINGLTFFYPFENQPNYGLSNLVFTDLFIYNKPVNPTNAKSILKKSIDYSHKIELSHEIKNFSISFSALEYNNPNNVIYQARLNGFEKNWTTLPQGSNTVTYTNLKPGKYTLHIKAHLPKTPPLHREIDIVIVPPVWLSWWAKILYLLIFIIASYWTYINIKNRNIQKKENQKKQNENNIMQSQLQFFTDISHEIRTPLTLILTPIEELIKNTTDPNLKSTYKIIDQNGHRILRLVNQVMEMRKLDKGQVKLCAEQTHIDEFIHEIIVSFKHLSQEKNITFNLHVENNLPPVWIDQEKLDKVIFNVLSNAFKYTPVNGKIEMSVDTTDTSLRIRIADTGCGIPKELRETVFNRFYQVPNENNKVKMGTGIGLHLSRKLMDIHHGKIFVEDNDHPGTVFVILLPLDDSYLKKEERKLAHSDRNLATLVQTSITPIGKTTPETSNTTSGPNKRKPKLLIVEDNQEIKDYIHKVLSREYQIFEAQNGKEGLEIAIKELPDCIISDVMMPEMDGIEMCDKIKKNEQTCHIPVIMLTAKTAIEQRIEGLKVGADSYIPNPFNIEHLKIRIQKLIELRRVMKNKYEGKGNLIKEEITSLKSTDEKFLEKLETIVKNKMAETDLSVEIISQEIGLSRSQLQRKLKQLTRQNPSDYIRITRLRHAAWLLSSKNLSISEVSYATGFSSLSHFSNCFKEFYGMSPSHYMEIHQNQQKPQAPEETNPQ